MKNNFLRLLTLFNMGSCLLTCVSDKLRVLASSFRSAPTTYWFFSNACSNFSSWLGLKAVRILFGLRNGSKNSGKWGPEILRKIFIKRLKIPCFIDYCSLMHFALVFLCKRYFTLLFFNNRYLHNCILKMHNNSLGVKMAR